MRYSELSIQTQRAAPSEIRADGLAFLYRAGYLSRSGEPLPLGELCLNRLRQLQAVSPAETPDGFFARLGLGTLKDTGENEIFVPLENGADELLVCPACGCAARRELAITPRQPYSVEEPLPLEKVLTPECGTIAQLADFLNIPPQKTAKALMFTRLGDGKFIFVVVRGDLQLSEPKLAALVGPARLASLAEISAAGAVPGYASPIGLRDALIVVDELVARSANLVAGANEPGYHLKNTNHPRDYRADVLADLSLAAPGDACPICAAALESRAAASVFSAGAPKYEQLLAVLAEIYHDEKGLTLPNAAAPFSVYLMNLPGKTLDTSGAAAGLAAQLAALGIPVLYDDRDERAGVKFNDADLIGCPARVTVGERALQNGMVELKMRTAGENQLVALADVAEKIKAAL